MKEYAEAPTGGISPGLVRSLATMANRLRKHSLTSTSTAGSGHPSSCLSCAELVSTLFFHFLRFDVRNPDHPFNDRFVLSKGHAAPVLWAAWAEAGAFPVEKLHTLRRIDSDLEGHPTPRNPWVDVATGALGQGLSIGIGMALAARMNKTGSRIFVLLGDGEAAEGSVWEAAALAGHYHLDNLIAILDINRLGQSQATMYQHDLESYQQRFASFDWHTQVIDGHSVEEIASSLESAIAAQGRPAAIIARTIKGKGVTFMEDKDGWHGKPVEPGEALERALAEIGENLELEEELRLRPPETGAQASAAPSVNPDTGFAIEAPHYSKDEMVATRQAYGTGLRKLGTVNPAVVALDGDTKNSTYSQKFLEEFPDRFVECFIAEQNMVGAAVGCSVMGMIPFASTFACFLSRAYDHIRMAAISQANINLCGSHAGVSIGQDGPSQMGLEDLAMMRAIVGSTVFYPSDAVCAERLVALAAQTPGIVYIRTSRPKTPVLYSNDEDFRIGGSKVIKSSSEDRATIVAAGVTLHQALQAYQELRSQNLPVRVIDLYSVKPLDEETLRKAARETDVLITVEDHYPEGGLGDAVLSILANESCKFRKLAVNGLPRSGKPAELMDTFGINARAIVTAVRELAS
ncbi:MAG: transketolase [Acidobacteriota bacterium]